MTTKTRYKISWIEPQFIKIKKERKNKKQPKMEETLSFVGNHLSNEIEVVFIRILGSSA